MGVNIDSLLGGQIVDTTPGKTTKQKSNIDALLTPSMVKGKEDDIMDFEIFKTKLEEEYKQSLIPEFIEQEYAKKNQKDVPVTDKNLPPLNFFDRIRSTTVSELTPFVAGGVEIKQMGNLLAAANRLKQGKESSHDLEVLQEYISKQDQDTTFGYKVMDVITMMPSFAGELYLTAGFASAGRVATVKAAKEGLKYVMTKSGRELLEKRLAEKGLARRVGAEIVGRTVQTPVAGATRIIASTVEKQLQSTLTAEDEANKEDLGVSLTKAFGEQWVETVSEFSGGVLSFLARPVKNKLIQTALFAAFKKANPGSTAAKFQSVVRKVGYNGIIGEMFEERVGEIAHGVLNSIGLSDQEFKLPTGEQLAVELVAFSVPGVGVAALNRIVEGKNGMSIDKNPPVETLVFGEPPKPKEVIEPGKAVEPPTKKKEVKKEEAFINVLTEKLVAGDKAFIEKMRERVENKPKLKSAFERSLLVAEQAAAKAQREKSTVTEEEVDTYIAGHKAFKTLSQANVEKLIELQNKKRLKTHEKEDLKKLQELQAQKDKLTATEVSTLEEYRQHFIRLSEEYDKADESLGVAERQEKALEQYIKNSNVSLTEEQREFILDEIVYMGKGIFEDPSSFTDRFLAGKSFEEMKKVAGEPKLFVPKLELPADKGKSIKVTTVAENDIEGQLEFANTQLNSGLFRGEELEKIKTRIVELEKKLANKKVSEPIKKAVSKEIVKPNVTKSDSKKQEKQTIVKAKKTKTTKVQPLVSVLKAFMGKKSDIPILSEMRVKDGKMTATNLLVSIEIKTDLSDGMYKIVGTDFIKTDTDAEEFPLIPKTDGVNILEIQTDVLAGGLSTAAKFVSTTDIKPVLSSVHFAVVNEQLEITATDAFRLYHKIVSAETLRDKIEFLVQGPYSIARGVHLLGSNVELIEGKENVSFVGENGRIVAKKISDNYPPYKEIYPEYIKQVAFDRDSMISALKELKPFVDYVHAVEVSFRKGKMLMVAENAQQKIKKEVSVKITEEKAIKVNGSIEGVLVMPIQKEQGKKIDFVINRNYLQDAVGSFEKGDIYLNTSKEPHRAPIHLNDKAVETKKENVKKTVDEEIEVPETATEKDVLPKKTGAFSASIGQTQGGLYYAVGDLPDRLVGKLYGTPEEVQRALFAISKAELDAYWSTGDPILLSDEQYSVKKMSYGKYFLEPFGKERGETEGFSPGTFWLEKVEGKDQYIVEKDLLDDNLQDDTRDEDVPRAPSGQATALSLPIGSFTKKSDKIGDFESDEEAKEQGLYEYKNFKLFDKVKGLIQKYAKTVGQGYTPRGALGVFYTQTENIRVNGLNDLSVASHEITHFLDKVYNITDKVMGVSGYSINGNPIYESGTHAIRKEMTDLYERYYPGGKRKHKLNKRMSEGFATLLQKYSQSPKAITAEFPNVVKEFLKEGGRYYHSVMSDIIKDLRGIISDYQGLNDLDKISARIVEDQVNVNKDYWLNTDDKIFTEIGDNVYPLEKVAKMTGVHFTEKDPSLWVRQYNNINQLITNNINGKRGYWGWRNWRFIKLQTYNWRTLFDLLVGEKNIRDFNSFLIARNEYFMFEELKQLRNRLPSEKQLEEMRQMLKDGYVGAAETLAEWRKIRNKVSEINSILHNDGFIEDEVSNAYNKNKDRFRQESEMYDSLVREDLDFLHDSRVQLLENDRYEKLTSREGYASMKREYYDEVTGEEQIPSAIRVGKVRVSSLIQRRGSQRPIISPMYSGIANHAEITKKGMKQLVYNSIGDIAELAPSLFQRLQLKAVPDGKGRILFPQEKDPHIIMARVNYKRVPILTDSTIKRVVDEVLTAQNIGYFARLVTGSSRFFTKGTTGLFPAFALTNVIRDQLTAWGLTRNKFIPLYDPLHKMVTAMAQTDTPRHRYFMEYLVMGGERLTLVGWQDLSPNELAVKLRGEMTGLEKSIEVVNRGMDVLAIPSKWSEIMTRVAEYIKARESGKSQVVAIEEAGRVSIPFHHIGRLGGGTFGKTFVKSIPFFNPGIQVLAQSYRQFDTVKARKRMLFVFLALTAAEVASFGLLAVGGDDEQKQLYKDMEGREIADSIYIPNPNGKTLIRLPVPNMFTFVGAMINMALAEALLDTKYSVGEYIAAGTAYLPQQFNVTQPIEAFFAWIPQIMKPGILAALNKRDFPRIRPLESRVQEARTPGQRFTEVTSPVAKALGAKLNISPIKIDFLLTGYFGRATGFVTGKPGIYDPFRGINREYYFQSGRTLQDFYDLKDKNQQQYHDYTNRILQFTPEKVQKIKSNRVKINRINDMLDTYRDIDLEKQPDRAANIRDRILADIEQLNQTL